MNIFFDKKILLIICGGIAAYKSLEIIRLLKKRGCQVKTILTKNATKFVTPLSVASLSQEKVYINLFDEDNEAEMDHISLSRWADIVLIAPATANTISKISSGSADDLASTVILASNKDIFLVPAMNVRMWEHPTNKDNLIKIKNLGYRLIGPEIGDMACGEYGEGKMTEPSQIIRTIEIFFNNKNQNKKFKAIVTAGPTQEFLDPVRFITNKSSGKQGFAIAESLRDNGFDTTLITGPTNLKDIPDIKIIKIKTAKEMLDETLSNLPADVAIFSAAVADFKINNIGKQKIKKEKNLNLIFEKNIDILSHISNHNSLRPKLVVGFAAETDNLEKNSKKKLDEKGCDWIIANDVSKSNIGFNSDYNEVNIFYKNMTNEIIPITKKKIIAEEIVKRIISQIN